MIKHTNLETVETLEKEIKEKAERIRQMKRTDSELRLELAVKNILSDEEKDQKELLNACYDYIAQHRALFKPHKFKKLDNRD